MDEKGINVGLEYDNACYEDNSMWFVERNNNILCLLDRKKKQVIYRGIIPYHDNKAYRRHPRCIKWKNYIVCLPDLGKSIVVYNMENDSFKECPIDAASHIRLGIYSFWEREGTIWCVSSGMNRIIEFNLEQCQIMGYYSIFMSDVDIVGVDACMSETTIICTSLTSRRLAFFDINTKTCRYFEAESEEPGYNSISVCGTKICMSGFSNHIYFFDLDDNKVHSIELDKRKFHIYDDHNVEILGFSKNPIFRKSFCTKNFIVFMPWHMSDSVADSIVVCFWRDEKIEFYNIFTDICKNSLTYKGQYLSTMRFINENITEIYLDGESLCYLNVEDGNVWKETETIEKIEYDKIFLDKNLIFREVLRDDLKEYIYAVSKIN